MSKQSYTLILGGSKGIGFETMKYFNSKNRDTISISRTKSESSSKRNIEIIFDLLNFDDYKKLFIQLDKYNIENIIFNLGDGSIKFKDSKEQLDYSKKINFLYVKEFIEVGNYLNNNNLKNIIFLNSICRFQEVGCRQEYRESKKKLFNYFKKQVKIFGERNVRINSITLGDVYHHNSIWKNKFENKEDEINYLQSTKLTNEYVDVIDVVTTIEFIINNKSLIGEDIILDGGHTHLLNN